MSNVIEELDRKRGRYIKIYIMSLAVFLLAWIPHVILKSTGSISVTADRVLIAIFAATIPFQAYSSLSLAAIARKIRLDPALKSALYNELYQVHDMKAWKTGFNSMAICLLVFSILSLFLRFDVIPVAVTAYLIGFGGYQISFYYLDRE